MIWRSSHFECFTRVGSHVNENEDKIVKNRFFFSTIQRKKLPYVSSARRIKNLESNTRIRYRNDYDMDDVRRTDDLISGALSSRAKITQSKSNFSAAGGID